MTSPQIDPSRAAEILAVVVAGALLMAYGLTGLVAGSSDLSTAAGDGVVTGDRWLAIEGNGWTNLFTAAVGLLLVVGSPRRATAKAAAAIGSIALGAAAVAATVDGSDVVGLLAANPATAVAWAAFAVLLMFVAVAPAPPLQSRTHGAERPSSRRVSGRASGSRRR